MAWQRLHRPLPSVGKGGDHASPPSSTSPAGHLSCATEARVKRPRSTTSGRSGAASPGGRPTLQRGHPFQRPVSLNAACAVCKGDNGPGRVTMKCRPPASTFSNGMSAPAAQTSSLPTTSTDSVFGRPTSQTVDALRLTTHRKAAQRARTRSLGCGTGDYFSSLLVKWSAGQCILPQKRIIRASVKCRSPLPISNDARLPWLDSSRCRFAASSLLWLPGRSAFRGRSCPAYDPNDAGSRRRRAGARTSVKCPHSRPKGRVRRKARARVTMGRRG